MQKPTVLFSIPDGPLKKHMFSSQWCEQLQHCYNVIWNRENRDWTSQELAEKIQDVDVLITGWGSAKIDNHVLEKATRLQLVAHSAGTVKWLVDDDFFERNITLTNANLALASSVAEYCLMTALMARWKIVASIEQVTSGGWQTNNDVVPGLAGSRIGLLGWGTIAKAFVTYLEPFDVEILVCSNHYQKGGRPQQASIEEVMNCDIVSIHKTLTPKSRGLVNRKLLAMMPDGGTLINTSRANIVVEADLIRELESGRINAVIDVFPHEPPNKAHPLRNMKNVIATPHSAGTSQYWRRKMADLIFEDIELALNHQLPKGNITLTQYRTMTAI